MINTNEIVKYFPQYIRKNLPDEVEIITIDSKESRRLNRTFRKKDRPTNVLSFRYGSDYGEIVLCPSIIRTEAKKQGNSYQFQMTWMVVHGMIHLAGMHHEHSIAVAARTELLEERILAKLFDPLKSEARSTKFEKAFKSKAKIQNV